ncbi:hypothetical protein [Planomonospora sphaerica]|uniref:hypothetical protein n=1 Tax=Planomonospora sphaerica TaxID=161355 RepID=UPI00083AC27D|nr:hypothetical protein [Planomonospora sphaerica]
MFSYPEADEVLADLGDKVAEAFARSVARTTADLAEYREIKPSWVSQASERGLANWIHDRLWYHLTVLLDGVPEVRLVDSEPTREIFVGYRYRLRAKRHGDEGNVSTFPTPGAIEFLFQPPAQETISGLEEIRLIVGYTWDKEARAMGQAVLSLRDGKDEIVWLVELPDVGTGYESGTLTPMPVAPEPSTPVIELDSESTSRGSNTGEDAQS